MFNVGGDEKIVIVGLGLVQEFAVLQLLPPPIVPRLSVAWPDCHALSFLEGSSLDTLSIQRSFNLRRPDGDEFSNDRMAVNDVRTDLYLVGGIDILETTL